MRAFSLLRSEAISRDAYRARRHRAAHRLRTDAAPEQGARRDIAVQALHGTGTAAHGTAAAAAGDTPVPAPDGTRWQAHDRCSSAAHASVASDGWSARRR